MLKKVFQQQIIIFFILVLFEVIQVTIYSLSVTDMVTLIFSLTQIKSNFTLSVKMRTRGKVFAANLQLVLFSSVTDCTILVIQNFEQCLAIEMVTNVNKTILFIIFSLTVTIFIVYQIGPLYQTKRKLRSTKYILYWDTMWNYKDFLLGLGSDIFKSCPVKNCYATHNKHLLEIEEYDAVVFHGVTYEQKETNDPPNRDPRQHYIYLNMESPFNTGQVKFTRGFFNWTMTYR